MTRFTATMHIDSLLFVPGPDGRGDGDHPARCYPWSRGVVDGESVARGSVPPPHLHGSMVARLGQGGSRRAREHAVDFVPVETVMLPAAPPLARVPAAKAMSRSQSVPSLIGAVASPPPVASVPVGPGTLLVGGPRLAASNPVTLPSSDSALLIDKLSSFVIAYSTMQNGPEHAPLPLQDSGCGP